MNLPSSPLAAPRTVYEPRRASLRTPSVKPVTFEDTVVGKVFRRNWVFILFSILIGIASGVLLLMLNEKNDLLSTIGAEGMEVVFYCLGWGLGLGWLYGFLITRFYRKLSYVLPVYATLLYMPVLLFILLPLLIKFTLVILGIVGGLLYLTFIGFMLFWMWSYFCGG